MKNILKLSFAFILSLMIILPSFAQEEVQKVEKKKDKPVRSPFSCTMVIDNQTTVNLSKGSLEFLIYHRMSGMDQGISNLYGFYGASNIHLALQYGVTDKLMVGFGTEKYSKMQEFYWKYSIIQQTRKGTVPVSVSYYGNAVIDGRDTSNFGKNYTFPNRISYFNQFIVSRKFNKKLSAQVSFAYVHFNAVEEDWHNDILGASLSGRYKIVNDISALFEYHFPIAMKSTENESNPNLAIGVEFATSTHAFQLFLSSYDDIIPQKNYLYNQSTFQAEDIGFGFNVHVKF